MQRTQRLMTSDRVAKVLSQAGIPALGPNKLPLLSRTGNQHVRTDGTHIRIFNILAFRSVEDQQAAIASWKQGTKLEKSGDLEGAQEYYSAAYNKLMSFSVLEENAADFEGLFEVAGVIEVVPTSEATQEAGGPENVLGFNRPRPVAIQTNVANVNTALWTLEEEEEAPATKTTSKSGKGAIAAAGKKAIAGK